MNKDAINLFNADVWASSAPSADIHEISAASPSIDRGEGLGTKYSLPSGQQMEYQTANQWMREIAAGAKGMVNSISAWDALVPYQAGGITLYNGALYIALRDNTNATPSTSASDWKVLNEHVGAPGLVRNIEFDMSSAGVIKAKWSQGKDNGSLVTGFRVDYRLTNGEQGTITTTYPNYDFGIGAITNAGQGVFALSEGDTLTLTIWATTALGTSAAGAVATSAAVEYHAPLGGRNLPVAATGSNAQVELEWTPPLVSALTPITGYIVQWRQAGGAYGESNQTRIGVGTSHTINGLPNDVEHLFRMRALNAKGLGAWSNEASATPTFTPLDADFPAVRAPSLTRYTTSIVGDTDIVPSTGKPSYELQGIEWNYRADGDEGWRVLERGVSEQFRGSGLGPGWWNVRYRLRTSVGYGAWSPTSRVEIGATTPAPPIGECVPLTYYSHPRFAHRTKTLVRFPGDGGSAITRIQLRGEYGDVGADAYFNSPRGGIIYSGSLSDTTEEFEKQLATMFKKNDTRLSLWWSPTKRKDGYFTVWVRAYNRNGWSDWAQGNTLYGNDL